MSEFGGLDLYQGAVRGMRAFDVDQLGRLRGVTHDAVWLPGENVAEHRGALSRVTFTITAGPMRFANPKPKFEPSKIDVPPGHDFTSCQSCGFYAYFGDENKYAQPGRISGVIEGYGVVHLGTNGFRAEKAKVVALLAAGTSRWRRGVDFLARRFSDAQLIPTGMGVWLAAIVGGLCLDSLGGGPWITFGFMASLILVATWVIISGFRAIGYEYSDDGIDLDLIRRNYPDVKIYRSRRAMLRDFPTDQPEVPSPETADDFWTREVSA